MQKYLLLGGSVAALFVTNVSSYFGGRSSGYKAAMDDSMPAAQRVADAQQKTRQSEEHLMAVTQRKIQEAQDALTTTQQGAEAVIKKWQDVAAAETRVSNCYEKMFVAISHHDSDAIDAAKAEMVLAKQEQKDCFARLTNK